MNRHDEISGLLPFYLAGTLEDEDRRAVEDHLAGCAECREWLALWGSVEETIESRNRALPEVPASVLEGAIEGIAEPHIGLLGRALQLLRAQIPLVQREIWPASALVMAIGYLLSVLTGAEGPNGRALELIAPLVAAVGVAMIYGTENDPALELALSTPTSPRQLLLARLLLVFGYDLLLALSATAGLLAVAPPGLLWEVALGWLGPMTFLSALALVLSLRASASSAIAVAVVLWIVRWLAGGVEHQHQLATGFGSSLGQLATTYIGLWSNPGLLMGLAAALVAASLLMVGRQEGFLGRDARVG